MESRHVTPPDDLPPMPGKVKLIALIYLLATVFDALTIGRYGPAKSSFPRLVIELTILLFVVFGSDRMRAALRFFGVIGVLAGGALVRNGAMIGVEQEAGVVALVYGVVAVVVNGYTVWALGSPDVRTWFRRARDLAQDDD